MSALRTAFATVALIGALVGANAQAADVSMASGAVTFTAPDAWLAIMQTEGDPEARVFQVPDPSPTGKSSLARVTITVKHVANAAEFRQYINDATAKAAALPGYVATPSTPDATRLTYAAQDSGLLAAYTEQYWLKNGLAIQLRCVRPAQSQAGAAWKTAFDQGCAGIAAQLQ